jgi:glycosyltransferase involved in cell wall biosynthesis
VVAEAAGFVGVVTETRPVRVLVLAKGLGRGGAERLLVGAARHLDRDRFQMEVAYLLPWKDAFVRDLEELGVRTHCLRQRRTTDLSWVLRLRRLVRHGRFDLVHTHMPYPAIGARLVLWPPHPAIMHTEHNVWDRYRPATRWANRLTFRRNAAVIAVSDAVADSIHRPRILRTRFPEVEVVRQGASIESVRKVTPETRRTARALLGLGDDDLVVGSVGNFTQKKDHATLLRACARLRDEEPRMRLVLVGTGPLEGDLVDAAQELGIGERVLFTGSRPDVFDLLPGFDVFALSSRFEGLPIALLEAMAAGLPTVATSVGGIPEVLTDGHEGFLVPDGDPDALAAALRKLLTDEHLRREMGEHAEACAHDFDLTGAVRRMQEIYESVGGA